jgi:hypothetical protein
MFPNRLSMPAWSGRGYQRTGSEWPHVAAAALSSSASGLVRRFRNNMALLSDGSEPSVIHLYALARRSSRNKTHFLRVLNRAIGDVRLRETTLHLDITRRASHAGGREPRRPRSAFARACPVEKPGSVPRRSRRQSQVPVMESADPWKRKSLDRYARGRRHRSVPAPALREPVLPGTARRDPDLPHAEIVDACVEHRAEDSASVPR